MAATNILDLPPEVLVQICSEVFEWDLHSLRFTCKTLASAAFERWAQKYIATRYCSIDSKHSLQVLLNIIATNHLAKEVKYVELIAECLCDHTYSLSLPLLLLALQGIKAIGCEVGAALRADEGVPRGSAIASALNHNLLYALVESGCQLSRLSLGDKNKLDAGLLEAPGRPLLSDFLKGLESIYYALNGLERLVIVEDVEQALLRRQSAIRLIENATTLKSLHLYNFARPDMERELSTIASHFLNANQYSAIKAIGLQSVHCFSTNLKSVLNKSAATLETLFLEDVWLFGGERQWLAIFRQLLLCANLKSLSIIEVWEGSEDFHGAENVYVYIPGEDESGGGLHFCSDNAEDIRKTLLHTIEIMERQS